MVCNIPRYFIKSQSGVKHTSLQSPPYFLIPIGKEKIPGRLLITKKIEEKFTRYLQEIYWHEMKVHTEESSFQDITDAMMEKLKE